MTVSPQGISIQSLYRSYRDGTLIVNRQYQRKLVWTVSEKQRLIDSILKDYPLPLFLLAEKPGQPPLFEVIDGMQRLNAIFSFIENGFLLDGQCFKVDEFTRARQAREAGSFQEYNEDVPRLPAQKCADMLDYQLAVTIFPGEKDSRITDVFGRINSGGKQLSDQERRQAGVLSPFAEIVRTLAAEIRGDVSRDTLLLSEMPEISIETSKNPHGYALKAEDIFWCYQGILRTVDLRDSDDEQSIADICASILFDEPVEASGEYLNKLYSSGSSEYSEVNTKLSTYGRERLVEEVKETFSTIRSEIEKIDAGRFAFRNLVYHKPTSNAQKSPFFAVFMAFHELMFKFSMRPAVGLNVMGDLKDLSKRIEVGQKHIKSEDRKNNIKVTKGLIQDKFTKIDVASLGHGPGLVFDFENSIRRSRTETSRYEFKQGLLSLDGNFSLSTTILPTLIETICGIANVGPDSDGYIFVGIADKPSDTARIKSLYGSNVVRFDHVDIVGLDRESSKIGIGMDKHIRTIEDAIKNSDLTEPLKTHVLTCIDVINYKSLSVARIRVPRQSSASFVGTDCFVREGSSTKKASGPQIAAISVAFAKK